MKPTYSFRKKHSIIGILLCLASATAYLTVNPQHSAQLHSMVNTGSYLVTRAVDGDTLDVTIDGHAETVRLIGVDTPETHDPRKPVQCFGQVAANYTKNLAEGKAVRLVADPQDNNRDKYNRLLRYVYLPDGSLLNEQLIKEGYGFAYVVFPFTKLEQFRADETAARTANRGLWTGCNINDSQTIKQTSGPK